MDARWPWPRVIAHRCGGALAPENTLAGLRIAAALGVRGVEFDAMLSADRVPVVIHDDDLDRTTDRGGPVRDRTAAWLSSCDAGVKHHRAFAGEPLPTLAAMAEACIALGVAANVEIKCDDADGARIGAAVAGAAAHLWQGAAVPPLLSSFSGRALAAAREVAPALPRALLVERIPADWYARVEEWGCIALHADVRDWGDGTVAAIRDRGVRLAGYTENDPRRARRWLAEGVDGLFTDRPDLLLEVAGTAGLPPP